ncbi:hypothetical protein HMPREF9381_0796 [Streptococcus sanguinis SK72]|jgi:hypothetical protein|uniref:Uncharacterized protein n=1 Tax=Streptococcus sanguinis SK72 TaxID=888809 RepID=F0I0V6_STRSA|nr:hypothetical protein [Streptococcus sanguinis]EGD29917.1 hypothetical protein HMPREF9381_0796 [Streptococcus sanguinis SK72]
MMKKKLFMTLALILVLASGSIFVYNKMTKPNFSPKTIKLYQRGFRLLEEQIAAYIKEKYSGIEKIEFSPIYVTGDDDSSMLNAYVRPTIYDKYGNKATLGTQIKKYAPNSFGIVTDLIIDFDWDGNEVIELFDSDDERIDVSNAKKLPKEAKLTDAKSIDINIQMLVEDGQLKDVVKDEKGSPEAEIIYNVKLSKEEG